MKSKVLWVLLTGAAAIAAHSSGCGGNGDSAASGQQGGGGMTVTDVTGTGVVITQAGPTGMGGADPGNHSFADALEIASTDSGPTNGVLSNPATSKDYYKFTGTKGQKVGIFGTAKTAPTSSDPFDPTYVDLVMTVFDEDKEQIAWQDDPWPTASNDPEIFMVLPRDGTYFVEVQDCNAAYGEGNCADPVAIVVRDYGIRVVNLSGSSIVHEPGEPNDTPPVTPVPFPYAKSQTSGKYLVMLLDGSFKNNGDVDVYAFEPKVDAPVDAGERPHAEFWIATAGSSGNSATNAVGEVWIERQDDPGVRIASIDNADFGDVTDATNGAANLSVPLRVDAGAPDGDTTYFLFVKHPGTAAGKNDFYFIQHVVSGGSVVETEPNDSADAPQDLTSKGKSNDDGSVSYFIEGDLTLAGDVDPADHFSVPVTGFKTVTVVCGALRDGSGLEQFTITLRSGASTAAIGSPAVESADSDLVIRDRSITGETSVVISLTAESQSSVTGRYYQCGIHVNP